MYWAQELANQDVDAELKQIFKQVAEEMVQNEDLITKELIEAQGTSQEIGGYYKPDADLVSQAMRPSGTLNNILARL